MRALRKYSGGTVPDSHRIPYSPGKPEGVAEHSNAYSITKSIPQRV